MFPPTRRCTVRCSAAIAVTQIEEALADISNLFAGGLMSDGSNWVAFPVRGPSRRMGGDHKLAEQVHRKVRSLNGADLVEPKINMTVAVADTVFASLVATLNVRNKVTVVDPGGDRDFLAPVPLKTAAELGIAPLDLIHILGQLGYKTFGSLASVEQMLLRDRFGADGVRLWNLANGNEISHTVFQEPHEDIVREINFEFPLQLAEQIVFGVRTAVEEIVEELRKETRLCTQFVLVLETEHAEVCERVWNFASGFGVRSMIERARWQLEEWLHSGSATAGVSIARFHVRTTRQAHSEQLSLWGDHSGTDTDAVRLVGKIAGAHGSDSVNIAVWRGGRDATEMYALVPALDVDLVDAETTIRMQNPPKHEGPWRGLLPSPLPALTVSPSVQVQLLDASSVAVGVTRRCELTSIPSRIVHGSGTTQDVLTWAGPWPIEERWWMPAKARRVVQMQVVLLGRDGAEQPVLLVMRDGVWTLTARYL